MGVRGTVCSLIAFVAATAAWGQTPLTTAVTYQGRLNDGGSVAVGPYDFQFRLFDASIGGTQVGPTLCADNVGVTDGLFTVALDFGDQFAGDERFLDIEVRADTGLDCTNQAGFVSLTPRQALTATPNALFSLNADRLDGLDSTTFLQTIPVPLTLSANVDGFVINAENSSTFTPTGGVSGQSTSTTGTTFGVRGSSNSTSGRGVQGYASRTSGTNYGVHGSTESTSGRGVFGHALNGTGSTYGGYFQSNSSTGIGAYGLGNSYGVFGESSNATGRGVYGFASAPGANNATGVYGRNDSTNGWAVFAQGKFGASGTKSFCIDHPDDPQNKYLLHYSTESPEVLNAYSGTIRLDGEGQAVVELPRYFAKINCDPRYTLTAVGAPMPMLHVAREIDQSALIAGAKAAAGEVAPGCSFLIAGGAPGGKVSWRVEARRNDLWVRQRGAPVEVEKQGPERGSYQHPELYGRTTQTGRNHHSELDPRDDAGPAAPASSTPPPQRRPFGKAGGPEQAGDSALSTQEQQ